MTEVINVRTESELDAILDKNEKVVLDFAAESWCIPCQRFKKHYDGAAKEVDVPLVHIDIEEAPDLQQRYGIMSVPTVFALVNGERVDINARTGIPLIKEINSL